MNIQRIIGGGLKTGFLMAATTNATIMLASDQETGSPWAAINAIAHAVDGDDKEQPMDFSPRESALGIAINGTAMCAWGVLYEGVLDVLGTRSTVFTAALGAVASYVIDYQLVPKRCTPGIEKRLSSRSVLVAYAVLGATLALSPLWNKEPAKK